MVLKLFFFLSPLVRTASQRSLPVPTWNVHQPRTRTKFVSSFNHLQVNNQSSKLSRLMTSLAEDIAEAWPTTSLVWSAPSWPVYPMGLPSGQGTLSSPTLRSAQSWTSFSPAMSPPISKTQRIKVLYTSCGYSKKKQKRFKTNINYICVPIIYFHD